MRQSPLGPPGGTILTGALITAGAAIRSIQHSPNRSIAHAKNVLNQERCIQTLLEGTNRETPVYEITGVKEGPTAVLLGGMHGNEINGYRVAANSTNWEIDAGRLIVISLANILAIEQNTRNGPDGDLNRFFPRGRIPTHDLARAIWRVIEAADPDLVIDLHRSRGLFDTHPRWVGQAIFPTEAGGGIDSANYVADYMNTHHVPKAMCFHRFATASIQHDDRDSGLLIQKIDLDMDVAGFIVELTNFILDLQTQIRWTTVVTEQLLERYGIQRTA